MSYPRIAVLVLAAVAHVFFVLGLWLSGGARHTEAGSRAASRIMYYACPMHPQYRSDKPGDCLSCGMRLEAVYADGQTGGGANESSPLAAGRVDG